MRRDRGAGPGPCVATNQSAKCSACWHGHGNYTYTALGRLADLRGLSNQTGVTSSAKCELCRPYPMHRPHTRACSCLLAATCPCHSGHVSTMPEEGKRQGAGVPVRPSARGWDTRILPSPCDFGLVGHTEARGPGLCKSQLQLSAPYKGHLNLPGVGRNTGSDRRLGTEASSTHFILKAPGHMTA